MTKSLVEQWAELLGMRGATTIKHTDTLAGLKTDAPGTNSRTDIITPDTPDAKTPTGMGLPNQLGYHQHGIVPLPERTRIIARENKRHPDLAHHGRPAPEVPDYNVWYDQWATQNGWDKLILNTAHGTITPLTTGSTTVPITLDVEAKLKLSQFPGAVMAFPVLLFWTFALLAAGTSGVVSLGFIPNGGDFVFPLGEFNVTQLEFSLKERWIIPAPVTDHDVTSLGTLIATSNTVVGPPVIQWRMGIGWAYLLPSPAFKGYVPMRAGGAYNEEQN